MHFRSLANFHIIYSIYRILLFIRDEKVLHFSQIYLPNVKFLDEFLATTCFGSLGELVTAKVFQQMKVKT